MSDEEKKKTGRPRKNGLTIVPPAPIEVSSEPLEIPPKETTEERIHRELGLTREKIRAQVKVSHNFQFIDGGQEMVIEYLRASDEKDVQAFLDVYDNVSSDERYFLTFEEFCAAADVSSAKLWGKLMEITVTQSEQTSSILAAMSHPKVLKATIDMAMTSAGHREKKMLHTASGFLPRPKGSQTSITVNQANVTAKSGDSISSLPAFNQDIQDLGERFQVIAEKKTKLLEGK